MPSSTSARVKLVAEAESTWRGYHRNQTWRSVGTDIKLTDEVKELGGLAILGTERHDSRRIDLQLRVYAQAVRVTRASRSFMYRWKDNLMKLFGSDRISSVMDRMKI